MAAPVVSRLSRALDVGFGVLGILVGVAGMLGWPRPFNPDDWWIPPMFCTGGLLMLWRAALPQQRQLRFFFSVLFVLVFAAILFADIPYPL